jgi:hypothetical protein
VAGVVVATVALGHVVLNFLGIDLGGGFRGGRLADHGFALLLLIVSVRLSPAPAPSVV